MLPGTPLSGPQDPLSGIARILRGAWDRDEMRAIIGRRNPWAIESELVPMLPQPESAVSDQVLNYGEDLLVELTAGGAQ